MLVEPPWWEQCPNAPKVLQLSENCPQRLIHSKYNVKARSHWVQQRSSMPNACRLACSQTKEGSILGEYFSRCSTNWFCTVWLTSNGFQMVLQGFALPLREKFLQWLCVTEPLLPSRYWIFPVEEPLFRMCWPYLCIKESLFNNHY